MPQKSNSATNLSSPKAPQFHQIGNRQGQQSKSSPSNQRVLILSTPIKLKDGTINMEQRTIPLRIDNSQLTITATENKNKIVSLKRSIEPPPLALPINQLNKQSTTFVKNEVGQVMGKLIPLGKFSNITRNTLAPISSAPTSPVTPTTGGNNLKHNVSKSRENKVLKLEEKLRETLNSKEKTSPNSMADMGDKSPATTSPAVIPKVENAKDQLITITDAKPKKRVHLVLKGYKNIASIGQTGTKIKLIPLDHWKLDSKSNLMKTQSSSPTITQPQIVDVRSCTVDEMDDSEDLHFGKNKLNCNSGEEDFDIDNISEKDPLDIDGMLSEEPATLAHSVETSLSQNNLDLEQDLAPAKQPRLINKPDSIRTISESGRVNSSKILTLAKGGMSVELRFDSKLKMQSNWPKKSNVLLKNSIVESNTSETILENAKTLDPVIDTLEESVKEETEIRKIQEVNCDELYKRFGISKDNVTPTETAMLSYICNLKKKLLQSQKSRVQALTALQPREYLGNNNLSNIQKRFVESQLRNSGRMKKKHRFIKTDLVMARDILKAAGPRGYTNLRKLFSLPDMSAVVKGISKT